MSTVSKSVCPRLVHLCQVVKQLAFKDAWRNTWERGKQSGVPMSRGSNNDLVVHNEEDGMWCCGSVEEEDPRSTAG